MKKIIIASILCFTMTTISANAFSWDSALNFINKASTIREAQTQEVKTLADIEKEMAAVDSSVQESFLNIVSKLSSWRESRNIKSQIKKGQKPLNEIITNYVSNLNTNKANITKKMSKLSSKDKQAMINNISTLAQDGQQYLILATQGVKSASNALRTAQKVSEFTTTLSNVNKIGSELKTKATTVVNLANQLKAIADTAGLAVK